MPVRCSAPGPGAHPAAGSAVDDLQLPLVIRPRPLRLVDVERRLRSEAGLAARLVARPDFAGQLARALFARDREARTRFADPAALAAHLAAQASA